MQKSNSSSFYFINHYVKARHHQSLQSQHQPDIKHRKKLYKTGKCGMLVHRIAKNQIWWRNSIIMLKLVIVNIPLQYWRSTLVGSLSQKKNHRFSGRSLPVFNMKIYRLNVWDICFTLSLLVFWNLISSFLHFITGFHGRQKVSNYEQVNKRLRFR